MLHARARAKRFLRLIGLERFDPEDVPYYLLQRSLSKFRIDLVFDIGANIGQFASELRSVGFDGQVVSFEPLSSAHRVLSKAASRDAKWEVYPRTAVGAYNAEIDINIASNSVSSSVLPMTESHLSAAVGSAYTGTERTSMVTLDMVAPKYLNCCRRPFLKIDTQGFEWEVLNGAQMTLPHVKGVLCELSLVNLYEGQYLWIEVIERLNKEGFTLWSIQRGFCNHRDGRTLQVDASFFRLQ
jgi:FkbM family methyltransferase